MRYTDIIRVYQIPARGIMAEDATSNDLPADAPGLPRSRDRVANGSRPAAQPLGMTGAPSPLPEAPKIAEKADDLEAIKKAVEDAAAVGGALWFSYLFVLFYLAIAAGAVTHADLFFEKPVRLPFLGVDLPLLAFFFLAPLLFLVVHGYTLVHLVLLTDKAKRFYQTLQKQLGDKADLPDIPPERRAEIRDGIERQLPSNVFVQFLAGPKSSRRGLFGWSLRFIGWITLAIGPVLLLLLIQVQFLPYHNSFITWTHRVAILLDLGLIWWLWREVLSDREVDGRPRRWAARGWAGAGLALSFCVWFLSWGLASFSGEWQEEHVGAWRVFPHDNLYWSAKPEKTSLHDWIFQSHVDDVSRHRRLPFSSTLVLSGVNALESLGIDDPEKIKWRDFIFRARGRDLRGAIFDFGSFPRIDFEAAHLEGASLSSAQFDRARFRGANFERASLNATQLEGALLSGVQLQGASLDGAQLQAASLDFAQIQGASLVGARLQGASLVGAQLQGASLVGAKLQGASLGGAQLQGASLDHAQLQGASLFNAQLQGASLTQASLDAVDLTDALLWRSQGGNTRVTAIAFLEQTEIWEPFQRLPFGKTAPWDGAAFQALRKSIDAVPAGEKREAALDRIWILACTRPDPALGSCDLHTAVIRPLSPPNAEAWRQTLLGAAVDKSTYRASVAKVLRALACSGKDDAMSIVRGPGFRTRLGAAGTDGAQLIDELLGKDGKTCPVSALLTAADRADLAGAKEDALRPLP